MRLITIITNTVQNVGSIFNMRAGRAIDRFSRAASGLRITTKKEAGKGEQGSKMVVINAIGMHK